MFLEIKNIGKIKDCKIDFEGITIIAGENSTGKSTISKLLFSIFNSLFDVENKIVVLIKNALKNELYNYYITASNHNDWDILVDRLYSLKNKFNNVEDIKNELDNIANENVLRPDKIIKTINPANDDIAKNILRILSHSDDDYKKSYINRVFNIEFSNQINSLFNNEIGSINLCLEQENIIFQFLDNSLFNFKGDKKIKNDILYFDNPNVISGLNNNSFNFMRVFQNHNSKLIDCILKNRFDDDIVKSTINSNRLKNVVKIINKFEFGILTKDNGNRYFIKEKKYLKPLNIENLSTGSKSLFLLFQIINSDFLQDYNLLILDEPEINLHPAWQLILAEIIVLLQKEFQLTCLIDTHSPYFVNAIETYSNKYKTNNNCKYYFAENDADNRFSSFLDCTSNTDIIYKSLSEPFDKLFETRGDL